MRTLAQRASPPGALTLGALMLGGVLSEKESWRQASSRENASTHSCTTHVHTTTDTSTMDNRNANGNTGTPLSKQVPPASPIPRAIRYGVAGALGGGVFAIVQHLGPDLLTRPSLVRWVFLYALLGGVGASVWREATRWTTDRFSLSRHGATLASGLLAGTIVGAATLLVATLKQGVGGDGLLLLRLPWKSGLGGFVGGVVGMGLVPLLLDLPFLLED